LQVFLLSWTQKSAPQLTVGDKIVGIVTAIEDDATLASEITLEPLPEEKEQETESAKSPKKKQQVQKFRNRVNIQIQDFAEEAIHLKYG